MVVEQFALNKHSHTRPIHPVSHRQQFNPAVGYKSPQRAMWKTAYKGVKLILSRTELSLLL